MMSVTGEHTASKAAFVGQSGIICCRRHVAKVPTAALKGILEQRQLKTVHLEAPAGEPMSPTIGRPIDASLGGRVLEDARKISRPAELGIVRSRVETIASPVDNRLMGL